MHDVCLQTKPSENLYSGMRDSRMNAHGVKSKSHLVYLTSKNCFLVENFRISLLSCFGDYEGHPIKNETFSIAHWINILGF